MLRIPLLLGALAIAGCGATSGYVSTGGYATVGDPYYNEYGYDDYAYLSPYGSWIELSGTRVWRPTVGTGFVPYQTYDYPWVDHTYNRGHWYRHQTQGWIWSPNVVDYNRYGWREAPRVRVHRQNVRYDDRDYRRGYDRGYYRRDATPYYRNNYRNDYRRDYRVRDRAQRPLVVPRSNFNYRQPRYQDRAQYRQRVAPPQQYRAPIRQRGYDRRIIIPSGRPRIDRPVEPPRTRYHNRRPH
jgi:hypothetical protein